MKVHQRILLLLLLVTTVSAGQKKGKKKCPDLKGDLKKWWHAIGKQYGHHLPQPIYPTIPRNPSRTLELFRRPRFVFFDLQLQIESLLRCTECDKPMVPNSQRSWSTDTRRMFDVDRVLLLNSYWYVCDNGHESVSGMAKSDCKASDYFNFLLTHEVGFTIQLMQVVVGHVVGGESLLGIGHRLAERYKSRHQKWGNQCGTARHRVLYPWVPTPGYTDWLRTARPSHDLCESIFKKYFHMHHGYIWNCMASIDCAVLHIDHTFKSVCNMGWSRARTCEKVAQKKINWITQYSSLFSVLNNNGLVVAGHFCANNKNQTIKNLLSALKNRRSNVRTVFTDQCCTDRKMLQAIFGREVMVYLEIFHFRQCLHRALPKHPQKLFVSGKLKKILTGDRHWTR